MLTVILENLKWQVFCQQLLYKSDSKNRGEQAANDLLLKLNISPVSDFDSIDNFELSKADMPLRMLFY